MSKYDHTANDFTIFCGSSHWWITPAPAMQQVWELRDCFQSRSQVFDMDPPRAISQVTEFSDWRHQWRYSFAYELSYLWAGQNFIYFILYDLILIASFWMRFASWTFKPTCLYSGDSLGPSKISHVSHITFSQLSTFVCNSGNLHVPWHRFRKRNSNQKL